MIPDTIYSCLPDNVVTAVNSYGGNDICEIRMRAGRPMTLTTPRGNYLTDVICSESDMLKTVDIMCGGSLHAYTDTIKNGFIPMKNGIRVGVCGTLSGGAVRDITSLCIRIPRSVRGVGKSLCKRIACGSGGMLIYSPPGEGKTTLIRDIASELSSPPWQKRVAVIDTRGEIYRSEDFVRSIADIYSFYPKAYAIELATRTMSPQYIICDELGTEEAQSVLNAQNCGIPLIATAHASDIDGLLSRPVFRLLDEARVFSYYVSIKREAQGYLFDICEKN